MDGTLPPVRMLRGGMAQRRWRLVRARREGVPTPAGRPRWRGRPRWTPRARRWLTAALVVAVVGGGSLWTVYGTSVLGVRQIDVTGSVLAGPDEVRAVAAVPAGTPLARVDTDQVAARVRTIRSVASVLVRRSWPRTLVIEVTERAPVAVVPLEGGFGVLDRDGVVFQRVTARPPGLVLLRLTAPGPDDPATRAALRVLAALTPPLRDALAELVADSPTRVRLRLTDDRVIVWGDAERSDVKAKVATALLGADATTIDVSVPEVATTR